MSIGTWILMGFSVFSALTAGAQFLADRAPGCGWLRGAGAGGADSGRGGRGGTGHLHRVAAGGDQHAALGGGAEAAGGAVRRVLGRLRGGGPVAGRAQHPVGATSTASPSPRLPSSSPRPWHRGQLPAARQRCDSGRPGSRAAARNAARIAGADPWPLPIAEQRGGASRSGRLVRDACQGFDGRRPIGAPTRRQYAVCAAWLTLPAEAHNERPQQQFPGCQNRSPVGHRHCHRGGGAAEHCSHVG